jgi:hypothetical protein
LEPDTSIIVANTVNPGIWTYKIQEIATGTSDTRMDWGGHFSFLAFSVANDTQLTVEENLERENLLR